MGSSDFIEDACDALESDPNAHYILIAAQVGSDKVFRGTRIDDLNQLKWFRKATDKMFKDLEFKLKKRNGK